MCLQMCGSPVVCACVSVPRVRGGCPELPETPAGLSVLRVCEFPALRLQPALWLTGGRPQGSTDYVFFFIIIVCVIFFPGVQENNLFERERALAGEGVEGEGEGEAVFLLLSAG